MNYKLEGHVPVPAADVIEWALWLETADRVVAKTEQGDTTISTVFLGIDHNFGESGPPLVFETMVFGGKLDQEQDRYATWEEAQAGHKRMVERVTQAT